MNTPFQSRRKFLHRSILTLGGALVMPATHFAAGEEKEPLDKGLVKEFVGKAHGDIEYVRSALEETPELLHACHDWGNGDFESAIEASSHVGHGALVNFLLSKGARMNIFTAAMLGHIEVVKSMLERTPELIASKGPHGLDLFHHARVGGTEAAQVLAYLESLSSRVEPEKKEKLSGQADQAIKASNSFEELAIAHADLFHEADSEKIRPFVELHYDPDLLAKKGMEFFEEVIKKCMDDVPESRITLLDSPQPFTCRMKLTRKDNENRNFYFIFTFNPDKPKLISGLQAAGRNIFE